jgi:sRNA-binding protein
MSDNPKTPPTLEAMIDCITDLAERFPNALIPYGESVIPTHTLFLDLCQRIVALEKVVNSGNQ